MPVLLEPAVKVALGDAGDWAAAGAGQAVGGQTVMIQPTIDRAGADAAEVGDDNSLFSSSCGIDDLVMKVWSLGGIRQPGQVVAHPRTVWVIVGV